MSSKRHHAEWLSLVEVSGPFLTIPVLEQVFPQGLDKHDSEHARTLRLAYEEWEESQGGAKPDTVLHREWIRFVLKETLGLPDEVLAESQAIPPTLKATVAEHGDTLRPDVIVRNPDDIDPGGKVRLLVQIYPTGQGLEKSVTGKHWKASPATRMMELLHSTDVRLGLITNGEHWMLVDAPRGETTGFASWYATLWFDEPLTLRAFRTLLGVERFFGDSKETPEAMLAESAKHQQEVTDQLGLQVRRAVEVLVQSFDRADQDHGRQLLDDVPEIVIYEAALTVMMRLVFLFCAEERDLLLLGDPLYDQNYAVSTLVAQLQEAADNHGEEVLERRFDAWCRLLSAFRAVYGGLEHERMKLPAYGGNLFDPDRFPFLEGCGSDASWKVGPTNPLPVDNRTVLHLLHSLQYLQMYGEAQRISFRALGIEQIGHVYEGLLDHTARRASELVVGLYGSNGKEPEVTLSELEQRFGKSETELLKLLKEETGRSENALRNGLSVTPEAEKARRIRAACGKDERMFQRISPFAGLIRNDSFDRPVVIRKGSVYVTAGTDRRSTGTHYTPTSLTEPIVQQTLEPLCYSGPSGGKPRDEWKLRSAKELLDLKVCDMACGSGAFLVQACRYLSELLVEAWEQAERELPGKVRISPYGELSAATASDQPIPLDEEERLTYARRLVAQRCLYGVDKNPLAVEMAKLSLWLLTLAKNKPFEFLDHAIRCGDSLVGLYDLEQLRHFSLKPDADDPMLFKGPLESAVDDAINLRLELEDLPANTVEDVERQEGLLKDANEKIARLRCAADLLVAAEFWGENAKDKLERLRHAAEKAAHYVEQGSIEECEQFAGKERGGQAMFHWVLEFPEVILKRGGFDAFICNPPFLGGRYISGQFGSNYLSHIKKAIAHDEKGNADLIAYFYLRSHVLLRFGGTTGLIGTKTVAEGDTLDVGLRQLHTQQADIYLAETSRIWPGSAAVLFVEIHWLKGHWTGHRYLDGEKADFIGPQLSGLLLSSAYPILQRIQPYQGSYVHGMGFLLTYKEAAHLTRDDPHSSECIFPCLSAEDFNSDPVQRASRCVIYFGNEPEEQCKKYRAAWDHVCNHVREERQTYIGSPLAKFWWQFKRPTVDLYDVLWRQEKVLVCPVVTKYLSFAWIPTRVVLLNKMYAFLNATESAFSVLQSRLYDAWAWQWSGRLKGDMQFAPSDCFVNFPFPQVSGGYLEQIGRIYHECRSTLLNARQVGLTAIYNRFNDLGEKSADIQELRDLHVEMDQMVAAAYGWTDLDLAHGFHETKQGLRYTISEPARREVLARLLNLNHERYAEEVKKGLHDKKQGTGKRTHGRGRKNKTSNSALLFGDHDDEGG